MMRISVAPGETASFVVQKGAWIATDNVLGVLGLSLLTNFVLLGIIFYPMWIVPFVWLTYASIIFGTMAAWGMAIHELGKRPKTNRKMWVFWLYSVAGALLTTILLHLQRTV